jgi:hypothetical protein
MTVIVVVMMMVVIMGMVMMMVMGVTVTFFAGLQYAYISFFSATAGSAHIFRF